MKGLAPHTQSVFDVSAELDKEFGVSGTLERAKFDEDAYAFYMEQVLLEDASEK